MPESIRQIMDGLPQRPAPAPTFAVGDRVQVAGVPSLAGTVTNIRPPTASLSGCVGVTWDLGGLLWVGTGGIEPSGPAPVPPLPEARPEAVFVPFDDDDADDPAERTGSWHCPVCDSTELQYWEAHPSWRTATEGGDDTAQLLHIDGLFEWGDGDDDPGLVCESCGGLPLALPAGVEIDWM